MGGLVRWGYSLWKMFQQAILEAKGYIPFIIPLTIH
jgi:hypothetical protein